MPKPIYTIQSLGPLPRALSKRTLQAALTYFASAAQRWSRPEMPWREVTVFVVNDAVSAEVNAAIMAHTGPTDVITQQYAEVPGEAPGLIGELYVNWEEAKRNAQAYRNEFVREVLLYIAHGCDHLTGADDTTEVDYRAMRRRDLAWVRRFLSQSTPSTQQPFQTN